MSGIDLWGIVFPLASFVAVALLLCILASTQFEQTQRPFATGCGQVRSTRIALMSVISIRHSAITEQLYLVQFISEKRQAQREPARWKKSRSACMPTAKAHTRAGALF
jgi:hypothetical protein